MALGVRHDGVSVAARARRPRARKWMATVLTALVLSALVMGLRVRAFVTDTLALPAVRPVNPVEALTDRTPIEVRTTVSWTKVPEAVTVHRLLTDHPLWARMHFDDWDLVAAPLRERALTAMIRSYETLYDGPRMWRTMTTSDWDRTPQPIRAMAYLRMVWHWARTEEVGVEYGLDPDKMAQSIGAIVMAESWFEHRAINVNPFGNRDLGLAQCSDSCRETLSQMAVEGAIAFAPVEDEYYDPWVATRVATVWFERELHRANGDVELAIRAYHRGIDNAGDERGDLYLRSVLRRRERYVLNQNAPPSWQYLARSIAPL